MTRLMRMKTLKWIAIAATGTLVTGCGGDSGDGQKPAERGVVTSASECHEIYNIEIEKCQDAIREAVTQHESSATKYRRLHLCEAAEGVQRCERAGQKDFSRRLQAFLISVSDPPMAAPLYATTNGEAGFIRLNNDEVLLDQDDVKFSEQAEVIAEQNGELREKPGRPGL